MTKNLLYYAIRTRRMDFLSFTTLSQEEVEKKCETNTQTGLTSDTAKTRLESQGKNELNKNRVRWWRIFCRQFQSSFVLLLGSAMIIAALLREWIDACMVGFFIILNAGLGFFQEFRSEQTAALLQKYLKEVVRVRRDGKEISIESSEVVLGDIVLLRAGDRIPADIRITSQKNLLIDESAFTGESVAVAKHAEVLSAMATSAHDAANIGFTGTTIVSGSLEGIVIAAGAQTVFAAIANKTTSTERVSAFTKGIDEFSRFILRLVLGTLTVVFVLHVALRGEQLGVGNILIFAIALAVGVIPEALPVVTTFSLSRGARRLAKHHVVVKRLSAIEDLGSIEILCSDKTGTLTENRMSVVETHGAHREEVLTAAALAGDIYNHDVTLSNPFDIAIVEALPKRISNTLHAARKLYEFPFDPIRRRNSMLVSFHNEQHIILRGAPEMIIAHAPHLTKKQRDYILTWMADQGKQGRRVLAIASKPWSEKTYTQRDEEHDLTYIGCLSFVDPVKKTAKRAVDDAKRLGVGIKILTGDSPEVAGVVAAEVGIIPTTAAVMTGDQFQALSDLEQVAAVESYHVFARLNPDQKYRIIELLQKKFEVGFLGEGINDAPALKIANVGMVVSGASHIAQEASDIILLGKSLHVIIDGIKEGREIFANTIKYIKITLASNFGNFYALAFASFLIDYLPMLPLQLLLLNLLSDFPMISIATDTVEKDQLKSPRGYDVRSITLLATILGLTSTMFDFVFFGLFRSLGPSILQTSWFMGSILTELIVIYSIRTRHWFFNSTNPSRILISLTGLAAIMTIWLPYTSIGQHIFKLTPPTLPHLGSILLIVIAYFFTNEMVKHLYYRYINHEQHQ